MDACGPSRLTSPLPPDAGLPWEELLPEGVELPLVPDTPGPCWLSSYVLLPGPLDELLPE